MTYNFNLRFSPASILLITNILVAEVSLPSSFHSFLQKRTACLFDGHHGEKITINLKELH
jgi:hypothetical protein